MDDFEEQYNQAIEAGKRNQRSTKLLKNWCFHAEITRSPGRGMIEAETGLPIGHMGVQCKFSKKATMQCWLLEDAAYDFYQNNCKACEARIPVASPDIMEFIHPREAATETRKNTRKKEEQQRKLEQIARQNERMKLRDEMSLDESFVLDLLDQLDNDDIAKDDPRLELLASLAPEVFTKNVIGHLFPSVLQGNLPYSITAAKALLKSQLEEKEKLNIAIFLIVSHERYQPAIATILHSADKLSQSDLIKTLSFFTFMALGEPRGSRIGYSDPEILDIAPARELFEKRKADVLNVIDSFFREKSPSKIEAATRVILAVGDVSVIYKYIRNIFTPLMRRRLLLPNERRDSYVLYYLREAAAKCFDHFPKDTDDVIQSFLKDNDDIGRGEAVKIYKSALKYQHQEEPRVGESQRLAFKRLLWAAVEQPDVGLDDAVQFFMHPRDGYAVLAIEHFDELIGSAATLGERYDQVNTENALVLPKTGLEQMEKNNKLSSISRLQTALVEWAATGARSKGKNGIEEYLEIYRKLPNRQIQMRKHMVMNFSKLLVGAENLTLVISEWYRALMDEETLIRYGAARAWEDVPYRLVKNFPNLFFEAFSVLLMDRYIIVHQAAVRSIQRRSFPKEKKGLLTHNLWNLIFYYFQKNRENDFIVDCIDVWSSFSLSDEDLKEEPGKILSKFLLDLEGSPLYETIKRLRHGFVGVPGFTRVALKSIQDDYVRSISIDDSVTAILQSPSNELQTCVDDIKRAFDSLKPFKPEEFFEALLYAVLLTKARDYLAARNCFNELFGSIPLEDRNNLWRLEAALIADAAGIEHAVDSGEDSIELIDKWNTHLSELEKENEERTKFRDVLPGFFIED